MQRGFTLIELMVAVFIIGLMAGVALLTLPTQQDKVLETEAQRLAALLQLAQTEAIFSGLDLGVTWTPTGYHFTRYQDGQWLTLSDPPALAARTLPDDLEQTLTLEAQPIALEAPQAGDTAPHVLLLSDGQISPFSLEISLREQPDARWSVRGDYAGAIVLEQHRQGEP